MDFCHPDKKGEETADVMWERKGGTRSSKMVRNGAEEGKAGERNLTRLSFLTR